MVLIPVIFFASCSAGTENTASSSDSQQTSKTVQVVAAENFYGDIAKQLGGNHVNVTSILSDPNVDPHEYESTVQDAVRISDADVVIENGADYDTWMDKLITASPNPNRSEIIAAKIAPNVLPDNPHFWYGIDNMPAISQSITDDFKKADPSDSVSFDQNLATFNASIQNIQQKMNDIKAKYNGTPVALTETIGLYQTQAMGLVVLTPLEFEKAIAEGNDPPAETVQTTNDQINKKMVKVLIYNGQTVTPITSNLLDAAKKLNIPEVYVTETMPAGKTYQSWMTDQLNALQKALEQGVQ